MSPDHMYLVRSLQDYEPPCNLFFCRTLEDAQEAVAYYASLFEAEAVLQKDIHDENLTAFYRLYDFEEDTWLELSESLIIEQEPIFNRDIMSGHSV
jgi:uncharacterized glyoxalase superfamily protein PhnB